MAECVRCGKESKYFAGGERLCFACWNKYQNECDARQQSIPGRRLEIGDVATGAAMAAQTYLWQRKVKPSREQVLRLKALLQVIIDEHEKGETQ